MLLLWILVSPDSFFSLEDGGAYSLLGMIFSFISSIAVAVVAIWTIVIQSKAIGEVHQFSSWKGFFTLLIPSLFIEIIVFIIVLFIVLAAFSL